MTDGSGMAKDYVEFRDYVYFIAGARVSLDSIVYALVRGRITRRDRRVSLCWNSTRTFGALAFHLANRETVDRHLTEGRRGDAPGGAKE